MRKQAVGNWLIKRHAIITVTSLRSKAFCTIFRAVPSQNVSTSCHSTNELFRNLKSYSIGHPKTASTLSLRRPENPRLERLSSMQSHLFFILVLRLTLTPVSEADASNTQPNKHDLRNTFRRYLSKSPSRGVLKEERLYFMGWNSSILMLLFGKLLCLCSRNWRKWENKNIVRLRVYRGFIKSL